MIETERLLLRFFRHDDASRLYDIFRRPEVARWSGNGTPMSTIDEAHERIDRYVVRRGSHPAAGIFAAELKSTGVVAGMCMLVPLPSSDGVDRADMEIGWHFHPDAWGNGYATEGASALVERAFAAGIPELYAVTNPDNAPSQAVCRRLGMEDLGLRTDWYDRELRAFCLKAPGEPVK
ncbi:GNAT family N-acetyltransferase [Aeromicrobium panaciterrae]|uniref:GNAT family N-acetyltransferase n=1 Tax=Aeromicrobium panaciterrae TaxID=363861 RepID=UPI0031CEB68B